MLELKIGKEIKAPKPPVNTYELIVTGMSGDGDHDEKTSEFGDHESILKYCEVLNAVSQLPWNTRCDETPIYPVIKAKAAELGLDPTETVDWYQEMVGHDITCEDRRAMLVGIEVFWYDAEGKKFQVEVIGQVNPM